jgi:hypothetical protein
VEYPKLNMEKEKQTKARREIFPLLFIRDYDIYECPEEFKGQLKLGEFYG